MKEKLVEIYEHYHKGELVNKFYFDGKDHRCVMCGEVVEMHNKECLVSYEA